MQVREQHAPVELDRIHAVEDADDHRVGEQQQRGDEDEPDFGRKR